MKIFLLMVMIIVSMQAKAIFSNSQQGEASEYMGALKDLIVATQKTRGATYGYHNGNTTALLLIYEYRSDMKKAIGTMESLPMSSEPVVNARATAISQALTKLNSSALKRGTEETFDLYTENIEHSLMLAQTINKKGFDDLNPFGKEAADVMLESILPLTENIGQLRAMGTGSAAKGEISQTTMIQMKVLIKEIKKINEKFQADEQFIYTNNKEQFHTDIDMKMKRIQAAIDNLIAKTQKDIFKEEIKTNSSQYFSLATDVISEVVIVFDINNRAIVSDSKGWL